MSKFDFAINCAEFARKAPQKTPVYSVPIKHAKSYLSNCIFKALKTGDREMKTYPYIGKDVHSGNITLFTNESEGIAIKNETFKAGLYGLYLAEFAFKNITAEYLANTYGEVKSKEHAHFIVDLGEGAGYELVGSVSPNNAGVFVFDDENKTLFFMRSGRSLLGGSVLKQITIPLPPECESVDEWLKVGGTVSLRYRFDSKQVMYTGELLYLSGNHIIIKTENGNDCHCIRSEWDIEKPKTPEQELRDELISEFREIGQSGIVLLGMYDKVVDEFLSKYNVNKKPQ